MRKRNGMQPLKIVVVGEPGQGKTCLVSRFCWGDFPPNIPTKLEPFSMRIKSLEGQPNVLDLWDTPEHKGHPRFRLAYPRTHVLLLCISVIQNEYTHDRYWKRWYPELHKYLPNIPIILVGTKSDERDILEEFTEFSGQYLVPFSDMRDFARKIGAFAYIECSAVTGKNVDEVFQLAIQAAISSKFNVTIPEKCGYFFTSLLSIFESIKASDTKPSNTNVNDNNTITLMKFYEILPRHLTLCILSFLLPKSLTSFGQACKITNDFAEDDILWIQLCKQKNPNYKYEKNNISNENNNNNNNLNINTIKEISPKKYYESLITVWINPFDVPPEKPLQGEITPRSN